MVKGVGIDIIEIERMEQALIRRGSLRERLFTGQEIACCLERSRPAASLAARFAAKEAVRKACSRALPGQVLPWREIDLVLADGRPEVRLSGKSAQLVSGAGIVNLQVSLTHGRDYACAVVVAEGA